MAGPPKSKLYQQRYPTEPFETRFKNHNLLLIIFNGIFITMKYASIFSSLEQVA